MEDLAAENLLTRNPVVSQNDNARSLSRGYVIAEDDGCVLLQYVMVVVLMSTAARHATTNRRRNNNTHKEAVPGRSLQQFI